jgi:hypothetical protein
MTKRDFALLAALYAPADILHEWVRFDGIYFRAIAEFGYAEASRIIRWQQGFPYLTAAFPLFPLLIHLAAPLFAGDYTLASVVVPQTLTFLVLVALFRLVRLDFSRTVAWLSTLSLLTFPTFYFLPAPYSETLFLLLVILAVHEYRAGRLWLAGLFGALASATRIVGAPLLLGAFALDGLYKMWLGARIADHGAPCTQHAAAVGEFVGATARVAQPAAGTLPVPLAQHADAIGESVGATLAEFVGATLAVAQPAGGTLPVPLAQHANAVGDSVGATLAEFVGATLAIAQPADGTLPVSRTQHTDAVGESVGATLTVAHSAGGRTPLPHEIARRIYGMLETKYVFLALIPLGLVLYMLYQWWDFGNPLVFLRGHASSEWRVGFDLLGPVRGLLLPFYTLLARDRTSDVFRTNMFNSLFFYFGIGMTVYAWRKLPPVFSLYALLAIVLPTLSGSLISMPRFLLISFPLFIGLGLLCEAHPRLRALLVVLGLGGLLATRLFFQTVFLG